MREEFQDILLADRSHTNSRKWDNLAEHFERNDLLPLWIADMDFKTPACVRQALHDYVERGAIGYYYPPDGYYDNFISWEQQHHGYRVEREWLRFSPGVVSCLHWLTHVLTQPGEAVLLQTPVYYPFHGAVRATGRRLIQNRLLNDHGRYSIDLADFERRIVDEQVRLFILCSPHNPVGRVWRPEELRAMLEICRQHQVYVVSDEIHQDLLPFGARHYPTALAAADIGGYQRLVTLAAASKTFNLAGAQNSYVIIPDADLRQKYDQYLQYLRISSGNAFGYVAAEAAFGGGAQWLQAVLEEIAGNYTLMQESLLTAYPQLELSPLEGTYLAWLDVGAYVPFTQLNDFVENQCRLAPDYGQWFWPDADEDCHLRLNLATPRCNIEEACRRLLQGLACRVGQS